MMQRRLSEDLVKLTAVLAMLAGHTAHVFGADWGAARTWMINISYMTAPIMCFFLVQGYARTRSFQRYLGRMLVFALLSQIPYRLAFGKEASCLNMLFTLALGLGILRVTDPAVELTEGRRKDLLILFFGISLFSDWGVSAPYLILCLSRRQREGASFIQAFKDWLPIHLVMVFLSAVMTLGLAAGILDTAGQLAGPLAAVVLLAGVQRKPGGTHRRLMKWFFYGFYPAHLLILCLLRALMQAGM